MFPEFSNTVPWQSGGLRVGGADCCSRRHYLRARGEDRSLRPLPRVTRLGMAFDLESDRSSLGSSTPGDDRSAACPLLHAEFGSSTGERRKDRVQSSASRETPTRWGNRESLPRDQANTREIRGMEPCAKDYISAIN